MKFKKFFAVLSAVTMIASAAAFNVNAVDDQVETDGPIEEMIEGGDPSSRPYSFEYSYSRKGATITNVRAAAGIDEIIIPDVDEDGNPIIGIDDFAFLHCDDVKTIVVPDSLVLDKISEVAFLREVDIDAEIESNGLTREVFGIEADGIIDSENEKTAARYIANSIEFMGKDDWKGDEDELAPAYTVFSNIIKKVNTKSTGDFVADLYTATDEQLSNIVRSDDEDTLEKMSLRTYGNFIAWTNIVPYDDLTIVGDPDSDAATYARNYALLGMNFKALETHLIGDANQDGVVNVRDCAKIANAVAFKTVDKLPCQKCADFNQDEVVNVRDAANLANAIATGKINTAADK